ncbi:hypothetical protein [Gulosibacter bifidus]|uniref:Uncharacterized protein n=1 Tax=Gulosibacter bifidus TaxID=272239 RepID=A0ABW5RJ96_9MICO|nr:hypothetical protein [Gulosibacter bifidus]
MAKGGTNRGGRRVRAGAKPDALNEKLAAGRTATRLEDPLSEPFEFKGSDIGWHLLGYKVGGESRLKLGRVSSLKELDEL